MTIMAHPKSQLLSAADCDECNRIGYRVSTTGEHAKAVLCSCVKTCPSCSGSGLRLTMRDGFEELAECSCRKCIRRVDCFNASTIPAGFATKSLAGFRAETAEQNRLKTKLIEYQETFSDNTERGFLLIGPPGVGKTHLLASLLSHITLKLGRACRFVDFFDLTAQIRSTYRDGSDLAESDLLEPLVNVPVLAIDELGKGRGSEWELSIIDQLISRRYNAGRIVLMATNYYPEGVTPSQGASVPRQSLEERMTQRIYSRLRAMCDFAEVSGRDRRTSSP